MEYRSKIFRTNVSTDPSCEFAACSSQNTIPDGSSIAACSSQNTLPDGSFIKVNTDMGIKKMRGGYTCFAPGCYSNTRDMELYFFHFFSRHVTLREKMINSIKRKDFILGELHCVRSQHFYCAPKQGRLDIPVIFQMLFMSKQRMPPKIYLPFKLPTKRKKTNRKI